MNTPRNPSTTPDPQPDQASAASMHSRAGAASDDEIGPGSLVESASPTGLVQDLENVALLLHQASLAAWEIGEREGLTSEMHYLGLGVYIAQGNTVALLPEHHVMSQSWPPIGPPSENDPARLVASAQDRLRGISPNAPPGLSDLVIEVCDLTREFREHTELDRLEQPGRLNQAEQVEKSPPS